MDPIKNSPEADPLRSPSASVPLNTGDDEALNWDFQLEVTTNRPSGVVEAEVEYIGRAKPVPLSDPRLSSAQ